MPPGPINSGSSRRPVVLLTFANDRQERGAGYLRNLSKERHAIEEALTRVSGAIEVVVRTDTRLKDLFDLFAEHNDRIVIFHYGGHAESSALFLEDDAGRPTPANVEGLASRLGDLPSLALVFLNGCTTRPHVDELLRHCRAPIIATDTAIIDEHASTFADRFYRDLGRNRPIDGAFKAAADHLRASLNSPSDAYRGPPTYDPTADEPDTSSAGIDDTDPRVADGSRMMLANGRRSPAPRWPWHLHTHPDNPFGAGLKLSRFEIKPTPSMSPAPSPPTEDVPPSDPPGTVQPTVPEGSKTDSPTVETPTQPPPQPWRKWARLALLLVASLVLVLIVVHEIGSDADPPEPSAHLPGASPPSPAPKTSTPPALADAAPPPVADAALPLPATNAIHSDAQPPPVADAYPPLPVERTTAAMHPPTKPSPADTSRLHIAQIRRSLANCDCLAAKKALKSLGRHREAPEWEQQITHQCDLRDGRCYSKR